MIQKGMDRTSASSATSQDIGRVTAETNSTNRANNDPSINNGSAQKEGVIIATNPVITSGIVSMCQE